MMTAFTAPGMMVCRALYKPIYREKHKSQLFSNTNKKLSTVNKNPLLTRQEGSPSCLIHKRNREQSHPISILITPSMLGMRRDPQINSRFIKGERKEEQVKYRNHHQFRPPRSDRALRGIREERRLIRVVGHITDSIKEFFLFSLLVSIFQNIHNSFPLDFIFSSTGVVGSDDSF